MKISIYLDIELGKDISLGRGVPAGLTRVRITGKNEIDRVLAFDETKTIRWENYENTEATIGSLVTKAVEILGVSLKTEHGQMKARALDMHWADRLPLARALAYVEAERAGSNNSSNVYAWNRVITEIDTVEEEK